MPPNRREEALHGVFERSLVLGRGFCAFFGVEPRLDQLPNALARLNVDCAKRLFSTGGEDPSLSLRRAGCPFSELGAFACDYFHEALQGLVSGLVRGTCYARHRSQGHGDAECIDVLHRPGSSLAYGPIMPDMAAGLRAVELGLRTIDSRSRITFLGLSQGVLFYRVHQPHDGQISLKTYVARSLRRRFPALTLREVCSRSVLDGP